MGLPLLRERTVSDMESFRRSWETLCSRLGVKPRQFALLLAVMVVAVGGLLVKGMVGPRKPATTTRARSTPAKGGALAGSKVVAAKPAGKSVRSAAVSGPSPSGRQVADMPVITLAMETAVARDPFRGWDVPVQTPAQQVPAVTSNVLGEPGVLPDMPLRAVVKGEMAVFGAQTVRVGDAVGLPDGTFARVQSIADRSVRVQWQGKVIDVQLGAVASAREGKAGGFR
ncbi:MAG: hypothetical protein RLZZ558_1743 [Planctomycetota bacterium]